MPVTLADILIVAAGGALGSVLRHLVAVFALGWFGAGFPWGTLAVNVIGSAAIGALAATSIEGQARLFLVTGLLGGFTTFSAFSLDALRLVEGGRLGGAALYVGGSVGL
ncbi:MAG TPA: CrcB family protein, partial [Acetobacteraceae bacterium]|nr:CrcB family protein [Acetobacteraceae bacterium]